jgi:hypothetical protein
LILHPAAVHIKRHAASWNVHSGSFRSPGHTSAAPSKKRVGRHSLQNATLVQSMVRSNQANARSTMSGDLSTTDPITSETIRNFKFRFTRASVGSLHLSPLPCPSEFARQLSNS